MQNILLRYLVLLGLLVIAAPAWSTTETGHPATTPPLPQGVEQSWWSKVQENLAREEYSINWSEERQAYSSPNRAQNLRFTYRGDGFSVQPRVTKLPLFDVSDTTLKEEEKKYQEVANWKIGFRVRGYGKGNIAAAPNPRS